MDNKNHLVYFLDLVKNELSYLDYDDFYNQIRNNFDFRIKVQKLVFIAKFFGWNHSYNFKFYIRGPYSKVLENDYYSIDLFSYNPLKIEDFDCDSFKDFIKDKSLYYLEAFASILYYKTMLSDFSAGDAISKLKKLKPYISEDIIKMAYNDILSLNFYYDEPFVESIESLEIMEKNILNKITHYINVFEDFGVNDNGLIIAGSLDYLKIVLDYENLNYEMKKDLLELIEEYIDDVEKIYLVSDNNEEIFDNMNLVSLENFFNRLQNYISQELEILPRLDDDEFDKYFY